MMCIESLRQPDIFHTFLTYFIMNLREVDSQGVSLLQASRVGYT